MTRPSRVLVTHPGRQHSHQAALALQGAGRLAGYWSGVPARRFGRYAPVPLEPRLTRWFPWTPALRRGGDAVLPAGAAAWNDFLACRLFDRWAAAGLQRSGAAAVIACEISALATFRKAKRLGLTTLLDAPSIHRAAQDRLHGTSDPPGLHQRIAAVKDGEIALADHVLTVSELARQTYLDAGVPPEKVHAVALGADLELFTPGPGEAPAGEGFVFLFAGATIRRKGFDLLLEAFDRVAAAEPPTRLPRLRIAGPRGDLGYLLDGRSTGTLDRIAFLGPRTQAELAAELRRADCLVLPSRNDSYAMVVPEALASGLPVLISEMVGAKDLVTEGRTGWIVPVEDAGALAERMAWCVSHAAAVRALRPCCRLAAEAATWPAYARRFTDLLSSLIA
ncbi:MAG TPA: glycosyltransferase family 4 protein [Thermoanaerobaculia bacterium]|jgi:glycosyltransferase involved in cell wall biosynthesis|nr:glycosyltransferase family 4 protein [Thermoanaerobaculia bacterium]